jgi:hypothetical protein
VLDVEVGRVATVTLAPRDAAALAAADVPARRLVQAAQHGLGMLGTASVIHDDDLGISVLGAVPLHLREREALWLVACAAPSTLAAFLEAARAAPPTPGETA